MSYKILIKIGEFEIKAELFDTECARRIYEILPIESDINEWGDEFYFSIPLDCQPDETYTLKVKAGDIGYWPPGKALAIFFGPTPVSTGPDPVPASEVNLVGRIADDLAKLKKAKGSSRVRIEPLGGGD